MSLRHVLTSTTLALAGVLATSTLATTSPATAVATASTTVSTTDGCVRSVPEPGSDEPVAICWTMFRPAGASPTSRVPMIMHSHGWGGSRSTDPASFDRWLDAGYGVLSFDQRGFGESGGKAHVENPRYEGRDVARLVELVAAQRWVAHDAPGDPRLGAIGGSYGGGYQLLGAFTHQQRTGVPVFDALAPEITWFDLHESLGPRDVVRTEWALALSGAALPSQALEDRVYEALVEGAATGRWPDGSGPVGTNLSAYFEKNGPKWHVEQGRRLDIPMLLGQGTTDTLFPLQQGLANWQRTLTPSAREDSIFVGYNGGHVVPSVLPRGTEASSDPCSTRLAGDDFEALAVRFMDEQLRGRETGLAGYGRLHLATPDDTCTTVSSVRPDTAVEIGDVVIPSGAGAPLAYEVADGPISIAGTSSFTGTLTAPGVGNRAFYGLAVGTSPADAHLVQNNVLPIDEPEPVAGEPRRVALPAVAVDVPAGQQLYLLASPVSDTFAGMSSRTPGAVLFSDTVVHLPVVGR